MLIRRRKIKDCMNINKRWIGVLLIAFLIWAIAQGWFYWDYSIEAAAWAIARNFAGFCIFIVVIYIIYLSFKPKKK